MKIAKNKVYFNLTWITLIIFVVSCSSSTKKFHSYNKVLREFVDASNNQSLIDHFPDDKNKKDFLLLFSSPPPCQYKHKNFSGEIYLIKKKTEKDDRVDSLLNSSIGKYRYHDKNNFIIDLLKMGEGKKMDSCNIYRKNRYPIPLFELFNFNEWKLVDSKNNFTVPKDLEVYVLDAKNEPICNVKEVGKRPDTLKNWKRGYSKGIAISNERNIIVYWTIVW